MQQALEKFSESLLIKIKNIEVTFNEEKVSINIDDLKKNCHQENEIAINSFRTPYLEMSEINFFIQNQEKRFKQVNSFFSFFNDDFQNIKSN